MVKDGIINNVTEFSKNIDQRGNAIYVDKNGTPLPCIPCLIMLMYFLYDVCNIRKKRIQLKINRIFKNKNWHHNIHEL